MIGGMMPLPASAEETVSGNTAQTENARQTTENGQNVEKEEKIDTMTVLGFAVLDTSVMNQALPVGASEADIEFPDTLTVTIQVQNESESADSVTANDADTADTTETSAELSGITWKLDETESDGATFDSSEVCNGYCYVYTPVLPETDADGNSIQVADGVELPMIYVLIGEQQLMTLAAEADHYDANGFCTGYHVDVDGGIGAWVKKSGADACTDNNCKGYQPATTKIDSDGTEWVEIGNAGQLYWFADQVDNGNLVFANVRLTADIVDNEGVTFGWDEANNYVAVVKDENEQNVDVNTLRMWNPIGNLTGGNKIVFQGHFNGQGHTVSGLYYCKGNDKAAGIFALIVNNSTIIEQIGLENSYIYGKAATGGITGGTENCTFNQCYNAAYILSDKCVGGIAGGADSGGMSFIQVFNLGHLKNMKSNKYPNYIGQIIGNPCTDPKPINCYAVKDLGISAIMNNGFRNDSEVTFLSREDFHNGKAAYLLSLSEGSTWGQDLSNSNSLPNPCGKKVYKICGGYTNDESEVDTAKHSTVNGFCTNAGCDYQEEPVYNKEDNVYEISNAGQLYSYAEKAGKIYTAGAKLTADIVVNNKPLIQEDGTPITDTTQLRTWDGLASQEYTFDGNGFSISGLYANGSGRKGFVLNNIETIINLQIKNSVFISTDDEAGGISARSTGRIENCSFEGYVQGDANTGGIAGRCWTISNCYVDAYVTGTGTGTVAPVVAEIVNRGTTTNSAYNKDKYTGESTQDGVTGYTTSQFASGEVAYVLNQGNSAADAKKAVWYQNLEGDSKDAAPSLKSNAGVVYQYTRLRCDGKLKTEDKVAYTNDSKKDGTSIKDEHKYAIDTSDHTHHKCSLCGETAAHTYTYEKVENTTDTIKATCSVCGDTYTVQLSAPTSESGTLIYDGTAKAATTSITDGDLGETLTVTYATVADGTVSAFSTDAPVNAGSYRARLTLGSGDNAVSVTVDYTIEQATPVIGWSDDQKVQSAVYTGTAIALSKLTAPTVTLLGNDTFSDSSKITYSYRKVTDGKASGDFISGLPADIGTYEIKASIPAEGNYTEAETADTMLLTIAYLDNAPDAVVTDKNNKTYHSDAWCPSDIVLKAPDGYKISMEVKGGYEASCTYTGSKENETITYYLKADNSGEIAEKSVTVKMDWTAPDFSSKQSGINIRKNWWNSLLSTITFGLYKGNLDVNIKADDSQSGVAEYYYYIDNSGSTTVLTAEELDTKTFTKVDAGKNGTTKLTEVTSDNDYVIYAYAVDAVGNKSGYICSDGFVLDNTAPKLTNVSVPAESNGTLSDTSATITFTGSEAGTYYYILKEAGESAPTKMSDFATKTAGDKVDTWTAADGVSTGTLTVDEGNTITLTKLKANTGYILYLAATDAAGNASVAESKGADGDSGVVSASFTTAKTIPYVKTAPVLSGNYGDTVSAMLEKADKTKASVTAGLSSDTKIEGTWTLASEDADEIPTVGTSEKYTLTFTPTGSDADTYDPVTCEVTPEVSKKPVTIVIADKEKIYGEANPALTWNLATGDAYADNVLVADDTKEALGISLSTTVQDNSNVGTYAITGSSDSTKYAVSFTGSGTDSKSGVLTVKQAANEFTTELNCSDHTYAKDKTPEPNATAKFGTVTYKYATAALDGTAYKAPSDASAYTDAIPVNAGIYAVKAYVAETDNYTGLASDPVVFTIGKAAEPTIAGEEKSYAYSAGSDGKTIGVDIAGKLPTDRGTTAYALTNTYNEQLLSDVAVDQDGNLTYKVKEADKSQVGATATITVTASMENYEDAVYTMTIRITDKKLVTLKSGNTVSVNGSNALTYGDKLSKLGFSDVTFVDADTNTEVKGTLEWADPDCIPTAGTTQAGWVFKPADSKHYEELTGTAAITVVRATPAVVTVPTVAEREYNPAVALADSDMTGGSVTGADGNELAGTWSFTGTIIIPTVNNKGYQAVFTPDDTNNYSTVTRTITVKVTKATPVIAEKPTAGTLIYGQELSDSTLTGGKAVYQTADGTEITGAFAWKNSSIKPTAADSQKTEYDVTFTPSDKDNYNAVDTKLTLTVNKAALASLSGESRSYIYAEGSNDKAETMDVAGKLPADRGNTTFTLAAEDADGLLSDVTVDTAGKLSYKVKQLTAEKAGKSAAIKVTASMENYEDAVYTMTIRITDKKLVTLKSGNTVSVNGSNALTYGDKLSKLGFSDVTFVDADTNTEVKGTLEWADPDCIPTAGTTQAGWVFKPADSKHYEELTGTAAITVVRATPAVVTVPTVAEREYNPAVALADSDMTGGSVTGADGNELAGTWSFTGTIIIPTVNNKGYQAVFTPDDTNNYSTVTRTITVKVTKATPVIAEKPTAGTLIYGQELSDSTLTGGKAVYQTADGTEITGAFAWKNSSIKPTAADSQKTEYDVTFTPSDKDNYNAVDTKLALTVNKAAQAPNMPQAEMAPAHSTKKVGDITLQDGWSWQEDDKDTALVDGVAVTANAFYTGTDKGNYETESVSITITRSECEHKNTEIINKKDATCSVEGYTGDTYCKDCGEKLDTGTTIEKKPHTVKTSATCVSKAVCSVCGETFGEVDASNHVHTTVKNQKEATCTQTGYTGDTYCTDCDKLLGMGKELAALGHSYTSKVTKAATITEEGIMTYTCSKCGHSYTQPIAKLKIDDGNEDNGNDNGTSIKTYIKDDSGKEGWDVIKPQLEKAKSGETVTVAMNGTSVVPKTVIDSIKGKDTTLVLDMGNGLSWKINGKEITDAAGDIDFGVTIGADAGKSIPVDVINKVSGERYSMNLSLAYDGEFGFTATLTVNMEPKNSGMYANLFYYNEQTGKLEFISAGQIDSDGNVELAFTHASDYTIVVDANIMSDNSQAAGNADETIPAPKTDDSISKYAWNNTMIIIIGICIILIVLGAVFYVRKKSSSEAE